MGVLVSWDSEHDLLTGLSEVRSGSRRAVEARPGKTGRAVPTLSGRPWGMTESHRGLVPESRKHGRGAA